MNAMEHFGLTEPKHSNKWMPTIAGLATLFHDAISQHGTAAAVRTYRTVASALQLIQEQLDKDIAAAEDVLEKASHISQETPAVVELSERYEDLFHIKRHCAVRLM
jgi:hypothetical protein